MGTRAISGLVALVLLLAATPASAAAATAQVPELEQDRALPGCGICYPGGYDLNTVGNVRGTVRGLQLPEEGPVRFIVEGQGERWVVLASPTWHWRAAGMHLIAGGGVTVRGSKALGSDGTLYLLAQEILPAEAGAPLLLREVRGRPLWRIGRHGDADRGSSREAGRGRDHGACRP